LGASCGKAGVDTQSLVFFSSSYANLPSEKSPSEIRGHLVNNHIMTLREFALGPPINFSANFFVLSSSVIPFSGISAIGKKIQEVYKECEVRGGHEFEQDDRNGDLWLFQFFVFPFLFLCPPDWASFGWEITAFYLFTATLSRNPRVIFMFRLYVAFLFVLLQLGLTHQRNKGSKRAGSMSGSGRAIRKVDSRQQTSGVDSPLRSNPSPKHGP